MSRKGGDFRSLGGGVINPALDGLVHAERGMVYYLCGFDPQTPLRGVGCSLTGLKIGRAALKRMGVTCIKNLRICNIVGVLSMYVAGSTSLCLIIASHNQRLLL
jgi:hypothetical protein